MQILLLILQNFYYAYNYIQCVYGLWNCIKNYINYRFAVRKYYFMHVLLLNTAYKYSVYYLAVMTSVMSQFPNIDPYRWPGWCLTVITTIYILITVIMFRNPRKCTPPKCFNTCTQLKFSVQLKSKWHIRLLVSSTIIIIVIVTLLL